MTSNRPTNEHPLDRSSTEETWASSAAELQTEQSVSAAMEKPALDNVSENLMEQIVDRENIEIAWAKVRANRGAGTAAQRWSGLTGSRSTNSPSTSGPCGQTSSNNC